MIPIKDFSKDISPKVNVMAWPEFEIAYYDLLVQLFSHYTTGTPPYPRLLRSHSQHVKSFNLEVTGN